MEKKKIAFVISSMSSGGAERVVSTLSNQLIDKYKVYIITMVKKPSFYTLHNDITLLSCVEKISPSKGVFDALQSNFVLYKAIVGFIREYRIDLCIGFMTANNILATLAAKRCGIHVVVSERNNPYLEGNRVNGLWKRLRRFIYPRADVLVVQTQRVKSFYESFIDSTKLVTIPNPINPDFKLSTTEKKGNIILNVGSLTDQKGQDMLIRAFAKTNTTNWHLHIIGDGDNKKKLQRLIENLNVKESISLLGRRSDIATYYAKSRIFAFASLYEGFPNALQEAMFFGLPCISTDCPTGPAEMIKDSVNGFLIPVGNEFIMTEKLKILMKNDALRATLGQEAKKTMKLYEINKIIDQWVTLFDKLIS